MATLTPMLPAQQVDYPESDGKPMAETDVHRQAMLDTIATLSDFFRDRPDVYVAGNLLLYYEEGNPAASVAPDVFVVFGVAKGLRRTYKVWEERHAPTVVIEITSRATALEDQGNKRVLYAWLEVSEDFLCDPLADYLTLSLQGFRLEDGEYRRLALDGEGAVVSEALGLRLQQEGARLRLIDVGSGERLLWPDEVAAARRAAEEQAHREAEARRAAEEQLAATEAELARLRTELARLRDASSGDM